MKTLEQILQYKSDNVIDGRDVSRLADFVPSDKLEAIGLTLKEGADPNDHKVEKLTEENVLKHLASDLEFAFEKALNRRGISASLMHGVIQMWMWVLDDPLAEDQEYAQYGLPLFKKVAVKYKLNNPIGEDYGNEAKYSSDGEYWD